MPGFENIGRAVETFYNALETWHHDHPRLRKIVYGGLLYGATAASSVIAHNNGNHGLEKVLDLGNVAGTGTYLLANANTIFAPGYLRDILKAGILAGMAYGGVGEARDLAFNYDAPDMASKIAETLPIIARSNPTYERIAAAVFGLGYLLARGASGFNRSRSHRVPHVRLHH